MHAILRIDLQARVPTTFITQDFIDAGRAEALLGGIVLRQAGQFADAQAAYERALALDPNYADAERNLAILHDLYLDNPSAALPHFERYQLLTQGADTQVTAWVAELKARIAAVTRTAEATP